jgi:regulator of nucleoside diphosphate kinase
MSRPDRPQITIAEESVAHLEALVEGAAARTPAVADRLLEELARARIMPAARVPADVAGIGSEIVWRDETTGREHRATLVWPEEADIAAGRVSVLTPVGVALLGLKAGTRFNWETRGGESRELSVLSVSNPAAAAAVAAG